MSMYTHIAPASTYIRVCRRPHRYIYYLYQNQMVVFHTEGKLKPEDSVGGQSLKK